MSGQIQLASSGATGAGQNLGGVGDAAKFVQVDPATGAAVTPGSGPLAAPYAAQQLVTGSPVALAAHTLKNGLIITASPKNTGVVLVGASGMTATNAGAGTGYPLVAGQSASVACSDASQVYIVGETGNTSATDFVSVIGN